VHVPHASRASLVYGPGTFSIGTVVLLPRTLKDPLRPFFGDEPERSEKQHSIVKLVLEA